VLVPLERPKERICEVAAHLAAATCRFLRSPAGGGWVIALTTADVAEHNRSGRRGWVCPGADVARKGQRKAVGTRRRRLSVGGPQRPGNRAAEAERGKKSSDPSRFQTPEQDRTFAVDPQKWLAAQQP
jgi:hypothetical protein